MLKRSKFVTERTTTHNTTHIPQRTTTQFNRNHIRYLVTLSTTNAILAIDKILL